jgi:hypothetical protein
MPIGTKARSHTKKRVAKAKAHAGGAKASAVGAKGRAGGAKASGPGTNVVEQTSSTLARLLAQTPGNSRKTNDAFRSLFPEDHCEKLGRDTKAVNVEREATQWAVTIAVLLKKSPGAVRYSRERFRFFLDCVEHLRRARLIDAERAGDGKSRAAVLAQARADALAARAELVDALSQIVGRGTKLRQSFERALGRSEGHLDLASSLENLSTLAAVLLSSDDDATHVLVASSRLTHADVETAAAAAETLRNAVSEKQLGGRVVARDGVQTNRIEGRVLEEMRTAMAAFAAGHAKNSEVPRLVPGASIGHVFGQRTPGGANGGGKGRGRATAGASGETDSGTAG